MNPIFKKYFKIFIILIIFFLLTYFVLYITYFDSYCSKYSQKVESYEKMNLVIIWKCKTNFMCKLDSEKYVFWKLYEYNCIKQNIDKFELEYYYNLYKNLTKKIWVN